MRITALLLILPAISPAQQIAIGSYPVPTAYSSPNAIVTGQDGVLWFTEFYANKIGRITTAGALTEYALPIGSGDPSWIVAGPDGALWFTENGTGKIGRITTSGLITEYPVPAGYGQPSGIAEGSDGALWFTETGQFGVPAIGRITTQGLITEYPVPTSNSDPAGITAGPDGALWFTEFDAGCIGRITVNGAITEYPVPTSNSEPLAITAGPDGALWFTEYGGNKIGRITTAGVLSEYALPSAQTSVPYGITPGPDGALWFTEYTGNKIARITTAGVITEYPLTITGLYDNPVGITTGPDRELWFAESGSNGIGEAVFVTANLQVTPTSGVDRSPLKFSGRAFAPNESVRIYTSGVGSALLAIATADAAGSFTANARAPVSPYGPRLFLGLGQSSGDLGAATLSIQSRVLIAPASGPAGTLVTLKGYGFTSLEPIEIIWSNPLLTLGSTTSDVTGNFTTHFKVPSGAPPGSNTVEAEGFFAAGGIATFTVQ